MPKAKPDQVIIHRIEFQESERELLRQVATAYTVDRVTKGVYNITSDATTVIVLIIVYEMITDEDTGILDAIGNLGGDLTSALVNGWRDYRQTQQYAEEYDERAHSVLGGLRNLFHNIIDALTGGPIVRFQEAQEENNSSGGSGGGGGF
jgi:hypothetical protein